MKVFYFIYSHKKGLGGHFRSLKNLLNNWDQIEAVQYKVHNIGLKPTPVLDKINGYKYYSSNVFLFPKNLYKIFCAIQKDKPDILHAYDSLSYLIVRIFSFIFRIPSFYTKCGGKNESYTPVVKKTIVFSKENLNYLKKRNESSEYFLIPNRIKFPIQNRELIHKLLNDYNIKSKKIIIRIGNLNAYYQNSIEGAFRFSKFFQKEYKNTSVIIIFIGSILDSTFDQLRDKYSTIRIIHLDSIEYTSNASSVLDIADYVIGTGRGAMEALALNKKVYISTYNSFFPIKVTSNNFIDFLAYNFSERAIINKGEINRLYFEKDNDSLLKDYYNEYCDGAMGYKKILLQYKRALNDNNSLFIFSFSDVFYNLLKFFVVNLQVSNKIKWINGLFK